MSKKWTDEELDALSKWLTKMACIWTISGLCYVTLFYQNTLTGWILGTLVGMKVWDWYKEKHQNEDNRHEATK